MNYVKERNFIVAYDENHTARGAWNILTNEYIGVKGGVIKGLPAAFKTPYIYDMPRVYYLAFSTVYNNVHRYHMTYVPAQAQRIEEIISLGLFFNTDYETWQTLGNNQIKLTKEVVNYLKENCDGYYSWRTVNQYMAIKKYKAIIDEYPDQKDWILSIFKRLRQDLPEAFASKMIRQGAKEKIFIYYDGRSYADIINNWYSMSSSMKEDPNVDHNIMTNYIILHWRYAQYKDEHYDDVLRTNNDIASLYYENDTYIVFPLLSKKAFHHEAEHQHNCVENIYMNKVARCETHIVAVRKKDEKDKPYITCEVTLYGIIAQYLRACNNRPTEQTDIDFQYEYQNHLNKHFKQE